MRLTYYLICLCTQCIMRALMLTRKIAIIKREWIHSRIMIQKCEKNAAERIKGVSRLWSATDSTSHENPSEFRIAWYRSMTIAGEQSESCQDRLNVTREEYSNISQYSWESARACGNGCKARISVQIRDAARYSSVLSKGTLLLELRWKAKSKIFEMFIYSYLSMILFTIYRYKSKYANTSYVLLNNTTNSFDLINNVIYLMLSI